MLEAKEKNTEIQPTAPIPLQNRCTGLSAPFQLNSKPNWSPQSTLQSSESKKVSHLDSEIMLPAPAMDTVEARAECRVNKLTLTRGRERRVLDEPAERSIAGTLRSLPLVRVNLLTWHSARASKVSMAGAGSMISESRWLTFFDSELCSVRCGDQFGLEFN